MAFDLDSITEKTLALPSQTGAALVAYPFQNFDENELSEIEKARIQEAEKRCQELKSGKVSGIPAHEVFAEIRKQL